MCVCVCVYIYKRREIEFCTQVKQIVLLLLLISSAFIRLGLDIDNCYFVNDGGDIRKDGSVDMSQRKVVQYVPYADSDDYRGGHGTHGKSLLLCIAFHEPHGL